MKLLDIREAGAKFYIRPRLTLFSHNFFVNRREIANVMFDVLRNESGKSRETEEKETKKT